MATNTYESNPQSEKSLYDKVCNDITNTGRWRARDKEIVRRRMGDRPLIKTRPYKGAPNFVEMIIDDVVREKVDQEISMMMNAPRICHAVPLAQISPEQRIQIELAFDSYLRYIIKVRGRLETLMDCKNARGFGVAKQTRVYNEILKTPVPDFVVRDIRQVFVPADTNHSSKAYRIVDAYTLSKGELKARKNSKGWKNVEYILEHAHKEGEDASTGGKTDASEDTNDITKRLVGLNTSKGCEYFVIWEAYHICTEEDFADAKVWDPEIRVGNRMVTVMCPDCPAHFLDRFAWKEEDQMVDLSPDEQLLAQAEQAINGVPAMMQKRVVGSDRPWPLVQPRHENRGEGWYDCRGIGHLCMDEQIAATQVRNMEATMMEYYQTPMTETAVGGQNSGNVSFEPGSSLPPGHKWATPPQIPNNFSFLNNQFRATASRRGGAAGQYNYSTNVGATRKVEKTATEIDSENSRAVQVSSASVDRFNEPVGDLFQLIWEDMRRMRLQFPIIVPGQAAKPFDVSLYDAPIVMIPAANSKTLNPEVQLGKSIAAANFILPMAGQLPVELRQVAQTVLANYDPIMTAGWIGDEQAQGALEQRIAQLEKDIQMLAQGGKGLGDRLSNVETFADKLGSDTETVKSMLGAGR